MWMVPVSVLSPPPPTPFCVGQCRGNLQHHPVEPARFKTVAMLSSSFGKDKRFSTIVLFYRR
jgi:hypothetical protein